MYIGGRNQQSKGFKEFICVEISDTVCWKGWFIGRRGKNLIYSSIQYRVNRVYCTVYVQEYHKGCTVGWFMKGVIIRIKHSVGYIGFIGVGISDMV